MRLAPANLQAVGEELAIAWNDGQETYLALASLRRACPCAACSGEPDVLGKIARPELTHSAASYRLRSHQMIGGYAWQPTWEDGHSSGLYTFDYLRRLGAGAGEARA